VFLLTLHWHFHLSKVPGQVAVCNRLVRVAHSEAFRQTGTGIFQLYYCSCGDFDLTLTCDSHQPHVRGSGDFVKTAFEPNEFSMS
jgi:hypothetical protein